MSEERKTDYLKEDPPVPGQDWAVVSFVAPEEMVAKKTLHYVNRFMVADINKTITAQAIQMAKFLNASMRTKIDNVLDKLRSSVDDDDKCVYEILSKRYKEMELVEDDFVGECRRKYELDDEEISDRYKVYLTENRQQIDREFDEAHDHVNSVRGIKIRGSYLKYEDAKARAKFVRDNIEEGIHSFVAPVGKWLPLDFDADEAQDQEYMLPQLNELMQKYHENIHARNAHYQERRRDLETSAHDGNKKTMKQRLQETLRERKNAKMRNELESLQAAGAEDVPAQTTVKKTKKKKAPVAEHESETVSVLPPSAAAKSTTKKAKKTKAVVESAEACE